jgi:uncharacterized tellurite resistance protein B-like protein
MDWWDMGGDVEPTDVATIVRDMRRVALADGDVHQRELALIEEFEAQIAPGAQATDGKLSSAARSSYLYSLVMVGLADGQVSDVERSVIDRCAEAQGFTTIEVDSAVLAVKSKFLSVFQGVTVFREQVDDLAEKLGVSVD